MCIHRKVNYYGKCKTCEKQEIKKKEKYPLIKAKVDFYNKNYKILNEFRLKYWKAIREAWTLGNCHSKREQAELLAKHGVGTFNRWNDKVDYNYDLVQIDKQLKVRL